MHPLCSCESLPLSVCLSAYPAACALFISLLFLLSGPFSFSSTFLAHCVSVASSSTVSLVFPSAHLSPPSASPLNDVVRCGLSEEQGNSEETQSTLQPVTTILFLPISILILTSVIQED